MDSRVVFVHDWQPAYAVQHRRPPHQQRIGSTTRGTHTSLESAECSCGPVSPGSTELAAADEKTSAQPPGPSLTPTTSPLPEVPDGELSLEAAKTIVRGRRVLRQRELAPCVRCRLDRTTVWPHSTPLKPAATTIPDILQCRRNRAAPDGPCEHCLAVMTGQWYLSRPWYRARAPYMGCFRYQGDTLQLFRKSTQPSLGAPWASTVTPHIAVPTEEPVRLMTVRYEHGALFQVPVKLYSPPPGAQPPRVAIGNIEQCMVSYRNYLTAQAPAALEQAVEQSFPGPDMSSEVAATVYGAALAYHKSLPPSPKWDPFASHSNLELVNAEPWCIMKTALVLWLALSE